MTVCKVIQCRFVFFFVLVDLVPVSFLAQVSWSPVQDKVNEKYNYGGAFEKVIVFLI